MQQPGYHEVEHTADWALEAWAADFPGLLEQAARGMYALAGIRLQPGSRQQRSLRLPASDQERQLVGFLRELLFLAESECLAFDEFNLRTIDGAIAAELEGGMIARQDKEIKAVTFHELAVRSSAQGLRVNIVFDV